MALIVTKNEVGLARDECCSRREAMSIVWAMGKRYGSTN